MIIGGSEVITGIEETHQNLDHSRMAVAVARRLLRNTLLVDA
jgi:hypothetical protein